MKTQRFYFAIAAASISLAFVPFVTAQVQRDPPRTAPPPAQTPARDAAKTPATGTGVIRGVIVSDDNQAQPVRRALVRLSSSGAITRTVLTDEAGRFAFANLPAARFTLSATKPAWIPGYYGSRRPGRGPGTTIALGDGQRVTADFRLMRGAVIAGRIVDQNGVPVASARVSLLEFRVIGTEKVLLTARGMLGAVTIDTDDRGHYRIYGIPPGTYLISATISGTVTSAAQPARVTTAEEIQWALRASSAGATAAPPPAPPVGRTVAPAPVFYPGTSDGTAATPIVLTAGEERSGVDFPLAAVPLARVDGSIARGDGLPIQGAQLALAQTDLTYATGADNVALRATASPQGRFSFPSVRPGQYRLLARAPSQPPSAATPGARGAPTPLDLYAVADVTVSGQDIDSLSLVLQPAPSISGRVVIERAQPGLADLTRVALTLSPPTTGAVQVRQFDAHRGTVNADGTFRVAGVTPGRYRIMAGFPMGLGAGEGAALVVKSIMMGGRDVADEFVDVRPDTSLPELVITFTDRISEIAGTIFDAAGRRAPGYTVIVFPTDRTAWLPNTRRFQTPARTATDGTFKVTSLPPGDYFLAALTEIDELDLLDASFLEQVAAAAIRITLKDGEKKTQDLKIR